MSSYDQSKGKGKILKRADPSTIQDKLMVGYQGWFTCGGDGEPIGPGHHGWLHWFDAPIPDGGRVNTDLWPDVTEYSPSELFPAPGLKTAAGEQVFLFSSRHPKTVQRYRTLRATRIVLITVSLPCRHFHWMAEHGVDGAFLQRFASQCDLEAGSEGIRRIRDEVGDRVREAAEREGRAFAIMYDVSGVPADRIQKVLERDWVHLIRNQGILDSPNYLKERGKPVVALWGFGFENAGHTPALVRAITGYFRDVTPGGAYIMAGAPAHWRTAESDADRNPEFLDVWLNDFDAISPWTVGRYRTEQDADNFAETKMKGDAELIKKRNEEGRWRKIDYIPTVLPGGSGFNLSQGKWGFNDIKRNGGRFLWQQIFNAKRQGVRTMYGAMWDEYDEGTAFMPVVEKKRMLPASDRHPFLSLDEDGYDLPSDWYMRICGFAAEGLRGERRIFESFPSKELQDYWSTRPKYEDVDHKSGDFVSGASKATMDGGSGGGGGQSYQDWLAAQKEDKEEPPPPPYSLEEDDEPLTQTVASATPSAVNVVSAASTPSHSAPTPVIVPAASEPRASSPLTTRTTTTDSHNHASSEPTRQGTGPPPVNSGSRPRQYSSSGATARHNRGSSTPDSVNAYPTHTYNNTPSTMDSINTTHPVGATAHDPVVSLANEFNRHGLGSSDARKASSPPPTHAARPGAAHSDHLRWSEGPHSQPQSQASYTQSSSPTSGQYAPTQTAAPQPAGTQWPPQEWGIGNDPRHQSPAPVIQLSHMDQISGGANLSRPQTLGSQYPNPNPSPRPHSAMSHRPSYPTSEGGFTPSHAGGPTPSTYASSGASTFHRPNPSTYTHEGSPYLPAGSHHFPSGPSGGSHYSPTSSYPGQIAPSSYGPSSYPPAPHASGYGPPPHTSPPHSPGPGGSYYQGQHAFPVAQDPSYPMQNSYGSGPPPISSQTPYGIPHGMGYPTNDAPLQGGGFHMPAPGGDNYFGGSQPQPSGYNPTYISGSTSYGGSSAMPSTSAWHPGSSSSPAPPPMHPGRPTQSPYLNTQAPGPWFPTASPGLLDSALNTVDRVAGKKARDQFESVAHVLQDFSLVSTRKKIKGHGRTPDKAMAYHQHEAEHEVDDAPSRRVGPLTRFPKSPVMQTQYYPHPFHHQSVYSAQSSYLGQSASSNLVSPTGLDLSSFSRGSSLSCPHQEYRHSNDRGGPVGLAEPMSSLSSISLCATGLGFSGHSVSTNNSFQAEAIAEFPSQEQWQWAPSSEPLHGLPLAPVPHAPQLQHAEHEFAQIKRSTADYPIEPSVVLSPAAQRPTPASMAILLNQTSRSEMDSPQISFHRPSGNAQAQTVPAPQFVPVPQPPLEPDATTQADDLLSRERKHACTMCHKRFDRPSTLKKHFLVHTGEKAFVCDTCGRRFGVPSNLNRHVRRCILKPVNAAGKQVSGTGGPTRAQEPPSPSSSNTMSSGSSDHTKSPGGPARVARQPRSPGAPKRRRRAPSPSRWIPPSLLSFNFAGPETKKCTPVPLPPVHRNLPKEERDSWDENVSSTPYHPRGWKNVLPGPGLGLGLGGKDVTNLNLGGNGGYMLGRVLVLDLSTDEKRRV
ncbi:hypothetical protein DXG01_009126 [Tephrocybe rancida]|nr:hypothetical protein DXG01_009126 [Tephrocybe rancida]